MDRDKDIETDKDPLTAIARKEKELTEHDLERARDGNDLGEKIGRQNIGPTVANKHVLETKKREDEKFESLMRQALQQMREALERRLEALDRLIAKSNVKIHELTEEIQTTETLLEKQYGKDWKEKLKKGALDANDPLLHQWLMQQQQLKDYLERREKLVKERDDLEKQIAEIDGSGLSDHLKLKRMEEVLDQGTSAGVQEVWRDNLASPQVQKISGEINTADGLSLEAMNTVFPGFSSISVAGSGAFGNGIETKTASLKTQFERAAQLSRPEELEVVASNTPFVKGPKPAT